MSEYDKAFETIAAQVKAAEAERDRLREENVRLKAELAALKKT